MPVILVHGLWAPALFMSPLAARLASAGFRCLLFRYAGRRETLQATAERLRRLLLEQGCAHLVGHSLGGLVILEALAAAGGTAHAGHVVLLGTPVRGSVAGRRLAGHGIGRWMLGQSEALWRKRAAAPWRHAAPLGVVAGALPIGMGRILVRLPRPNDGVVCVEETGMEGMRERIVLPVSHSALMVSSRVAAQVVQFLRHGRFLSVAG